MDKPSSLGLYLGLGVIASVLLAAGLFMMKSRSSVLPPAHGSGMLRTILIWIRDPIWIGGLGVQTVGYALYVAALSDAPVSLVAVMMQGGIALFVIFATVFLHEKASAREWAGIIGILVAMVVLGVSLTGGAAGSEAQARALWVFSAVFGRGDGLTVHVCAFTPQRYGNRNRVGSGLRARQPLHQTARRYLRCPYRYESNAANVRASVALSR